MKQDYFTSDNLGINLNNVGEWLNDYYYFTDFYTREQMPLMINKEYMTKAQFHEEEGRGGYFAPESGTSESQFLTIKGFLEVYEVTKDIKWLNKAIEMADSSIEIMYRGKEIPEKYQENDLWLPHWLYNASEPFVSEKYYLDKVVHFSNGVAKFNTDFEARKVYSVRGMEATLEWENPFSKVVGDSYEIDSYTSHNKTISIKLKDNYTGNLKVIYADFGGEIIEHNEPYEAWAVWRKLGETEIACAIDSLWWAYDCYKLLAKYTSEIKWEKALDNLKKTIPYVVNVVNAGDYFTQDIQTSDPLSAPASYVYQERTPEASLSRSSSSGSIIIDLPYGSGFTQLGRADLETIMTADKTMNLKIKTNKTNVLEFILQTEKEYSEEDRYTAKFRLNASNSATELSFSREDFIQPHTLMWDIFYRGESTWVTYQSVNSSTTTTVVDEGKRDSLRVAFKRGMETNNQGYEYLGWSQFLPIFTNSRNLDSIPPFRYKLSGEIDVRLTDSNNVIWRCRLPESTSYRNISLSPTQFTSSTDGSVAFPIKELLFESVSETANLHLQYIGAISSIPLNSTVREAVISVTEPSEQKIELFYMRPLPAEEYTYVPYVAPFTVNLLNNEIDGWRGSAYTGYQAPWIWQELDNPKGLEVVLNFMERAQIEYEERTGVKGFFMPVFLWDRWDSREYGEPNSFTWEGADPNTFWGGFQYRAIETVAKTWYYDPSNKQAQRITMAFMESINQLWHSENDYIITTFSEGKTPTGDYNEPHMASLLLRGAVYAYVATTNELDRAVLMSVIQKSIKYLGRFFKVFDKNIQWNNNFLNGTWTVDNHSWYNYWGGEILSTLALLLKYSKTVFNMQTQYGIVEVETFPDVDSDLEDTLKVKTPIGIQKIRLVEINSPDSTPFIVMTEKGKKAIGGIKALDNNIKLLINNQGNAMKTIDKLEHEIILPDIENGLVKINSIKGKTIKNYSPISTYDYADSNWGNQFPLEPSTEYMLTFKITTPAPTSLTMSFKDAQGADYGWQEVTSTEEAKEVYFGFKTDENAVSMMVYQQQDGAGTVISDVMLLKGLYDKQPVPYYFSGEIHSAEVVNGSSYEIKVFDDTKQSVLNLADIVPIDKLPLRSNETITDEIIDNVLYKRIAPNGAVLDTPETIILKKSITVLESFKGGKITISDPNDAFPLTSIQYPLAMETYIDGLINNN